MIVPFTPERRRFGRRRSTKSLYQIAGGRRGHVLHRFNGCRWRQLPKDFPPYSTVQSYFHAWVLDGRWKLINHALMMASREKMAASQSDRWRHR
jgi:hypothetical protein